MNTYNPGWRDHPNLSYGNNQVNQNSYQQTFQPRPPVNPSPSTPLEDIVKMLTANILQFQQETRNSI